MLACAGLFAAFFPSWYRSCIRKAAEKVCAESSYQKIFGRYTLSLAEEGFAFTFPTGECKYFWGAIDRVSLTPEYLFILLAGAQGLPISRAQIPDSTIQEVKAFVESHIQRTTPSAPTNGGSAEHSGESAVTETGRKSFWIGCMLVIVFSLAICLLQAVALSDFVKANQYRARAEQGDAKAQARLGFCYLKGSGVTRDSAEAVKWFRKAADQGYAVAQYDLGVEYLEG